MELGNAIKRLLLPFIRGSWLETCGGCDRRRKALNRAGNAISGAISGFLAKITCGCWYKSIWASIKSHF